MIPVLAGLTSDGDNTQLLQGALATGGFTVPAGTFPIYRALVPPLAATLEGMHSYRSVIRQMTPGQPAVAITDGARLTIRGLGLTGPGAAQGTAPGVSVTRRNAPDTYGLRFIDVAIQQFGGNGIDAPQGNLIVSHFDRVTCTNVGGAGFSLTGVPGGSAGTSVKLTSCYAVGCRQAGYVLSKMCYSALSACACDSSGAGYVLAGCQGVALDACGTEGVVASGADMYSDGTSFRVDGCDGVSFRACWTYANSRYVLHVSGGSRNIEPGRIGENSPLPSALGHTLVDSGSQLG